MRDSPAGTGRRGAPAGGDGVQHGLPHDEGPGGPALSLTEVMARTGLPASTIHHYRRAGLLPPLTPAAGRGARGGRMAYHVGHVDALRMVKWLRTSHGLPLDRIAEVLPTVVEAAERGRRADDAPGGDADARALAAAAAALEACEAATARRRALESATRLFSTRSYGEVTIAEVAADAGIAKGSVYRHFSSKEELFTAVVEELLTATADDLAAVGAAGAPTGPPGSPAVAFATVVARAMPILLELGARAAKGHERSRLLARRVLMTLAAAAGQPAAGPGDDPTTVGLGLIQDAFALVLRWSVDGHWIKDVHHGATNGAERVESNQA
ncbi:MAG TPA: TetR family transcriptional regulator [Acidimicrobiales bacterium]|nr:TetR family transcriptional regulator [Acidimicrobiales bacterium]